MIPIVDLSEIRKYPRASHIIHPLDQALREVGFCYLSHHGIAPDLISAAQQAAMRFFSQPQGYKQRYHIALAARHSGYVGFDEHGAYGDESIRLYEAYDIGLELPHDDPDFLKGNIFYGPNTWPDLAGFRRAVYDYYEAISRLAWCLTQSIEAALGLRAHSLTNLMHKPTAQLRMIHYPENDLVQRDSVRHARMGAHTDYEFFTLLYQTQPGLQTVNVHGEWVDVPPLADTLVMNVGDMAEVISAGRYRSNPHRVLNKGQQRFSMPFFAAFDYDAEIRPMLVNLNTIGHTKPSLIAGEHLLQQVRQDFAYLRMQVTDKVTEPGLNQQHRAQEEREALLRLQRERNPFLKGKITWTQ